MKAKSLGALTGDFTVGPPVTTPVLGGAAAPTAGLPVGLGPAAAPVMGPGVAPMAGAAGYDAMFYNAPGECPRVPIEDVPAGMAKPTLNVPDLALEEYTNLIDGVLEMPYTPIENGATYCVKPGSGIDTILIGGTFHFLTTDGQCAAPPMNAAGEPCCTISMWQPNNGGFYYDNCSMQCASISLSRFPRLFLELLRAHSSHVVSYTVSCAISVHAPFLFALLDEHARYGGGR
jgi:hypothetical protein